MAKNKEEIPKKTLSKSKKEIPKITLSKSKEEIPKITLSNTKQEILEALNEVKKRLKEKADAELNDEKILEEKRTKEVVALADKLSAQKVVSDINNLKNEIGKLLALICEKLETEVDKYQKIVEAVNIKNSELKATYEIEKSASALVSLIEVHNQKKVVFEAEMKDLKEKLEKEMLESRIKWEKEKKDHVELMKDLEAEENKKRSREREEYLYNFEREKQLAKDKFKDELDKLELELIQKREQFEKKFAEKELQLKEREEIIQKMVKSIANVGNLPI